MIKKDGNGNNLKNGDKRKYYTYRYIRLLVYLILAVIITVVPFIGINRTLTEVKIRSMAMNIYKEIVNEEDTYNKLDLLKYLEAFEPNNKAISDAIERVEARIKTKQENVDQLQDDLVKTRLKLNEIKTSKTASEGKILEYEDRLEKLTKEIKRVESSLYTQKEINELILSYIDELEVKISKLAIPDTSKEKVIWLLRVLKRDINSAERNALIEEIDQFLKEYEKK